MNDIRVLLVESEPGDAAFIRDALVEMEEMTHGGTWVHCHVDHVERADEALLVLESGHPDAVLFNPLLNDSRGLATYSTFRDAAPDVPLIALLDSCEEGLGRRMLRHGAQDYLIKDEIDCRPLARTLLKAIERHRFERAASRSSLTDEETGFFNVEGFHSLGARDLEIARGCGRDAVLMLAELDSLVEMDEAYGREAVHQLVVEAANVVREASESTVLIGRLSVGRFGLLAWAESDQGLISAIQAQVQAGFHSFAFLFGSAHAEATGTAVMDELLKTAESALYENRQAYASFT
jgi:diguanylate cyclase